jgi:hypothetical protein
MSLKIKGLLIRILWYWASRRRPPDIKPRQLGLGNRPRRSFAHLPRLKGAAADQSQHRHLADLQALRRLLQSQLAAFGHLARPINRDALAVAEAADPSLSPGVAFACALAGPVQDHRDAAVRLLSGQSPDDISRFNCGAPTMPASLVPRHRQAGMVAPLPVDHELDRILNQLDDDLRDDCPYDTFARLRGCSGMMPERLDIGAQRKKPGALLRRRQCRLVRVRGRKLLLQATDLHQTVVPAALQFGRDKSIVRIDPVVLPACEFSLVARLG